MSSISINHAQTKDFEPIINLLHQYNLVIQDINLSRQYFIVLNDGDKTCACGAIEFYQPYGLIRSVAVTPDNAKRGYASKIISKLEKVASSNEITELYLLTETAESFFTKLGFKKIDRELAPDTIKQTNQFSELCPMTATVMTKPIIPSK